MFAVNPITETRTDDPDREPVWQDVARCSDETAALTELFFSEQLADIAAAKALCAECPVSTECLEGAVARREPWGVWGGQLFVKGKVVANKRPRGRPPKVRPDPGAEEVRSA